MPAESLLVVLVVLLVIVIGAVLVVLVRLVRMRAGQAPASLSQAPAVSAMLERQFAQSRELQQVELSQAAGSVSKLSDQVAQLRAETARSLEAMRAENQASLERVRVENARSAEVVRSTMDDKFGRELGEQLTRSFSCVDARLEQVNRGLGEMQGLAQGVGDLKRVLSNVKARGIVGEVQLGAILREVLAPAQYAENVATVPGSSERVEFAVRIPGEDGSSVWLPIDAKFPGDAYDHLREAQEAGDAAAADAAWRLLEARLRAEAKDIHDKYVAPPATTSFGILFLPFEGLYAEVAGRPGILERLQRESRVSVAGPSTMAAMLNSLEMGFQAVAIQQRANEVQRVLVDVRTEFAKYADELAKAQRQLATASRTLDVLATTRTRAMERRLASVTELETGEGAVSGADGALDVPSQPESGASSSGASLQSKSGDASSSVSPQLKPGTASPDVSSQPKPGAHFKQEV